jgi:hypothetical protein
MSSRDRNAGISNDPMSTYGPQDSKLSYVRRVHNYPFSAIRVGLVVQFNVGMYSAMVQVATGEYYTCSIGVFNATPGFGYSDDIVLREGDEVIFALLPNDKRAGIILARRPIRYSKDRNHPVKVESDTKLERRTSFFSKDCYRKLSPAYDIPLKTPNDTSTGRYMCNRPTDMVPGESGMLNPHRCGFLNNMYSTSMVGGGAFIKLFSIENRIRVVADSMIKYTFFGNDNEWHNRRYLSKEHHGCMYQEERLGMKSKEAVPFEKSDYDKDGYFIKNKVKGQTLRDRILDQEGYFAGLSVRYRMRPDPDDHEPRAMTDKEIQNPGVARESVDPSGQYRLATTGMLGFERIGRIPVPMRILHPWNLDADEPPAEALEEFKHNEGHPFWRQLELADRVAYDLKNSYRRIDESPMEFYLPQEEDLEGKLQDVYDPGFTESKTVKLEKYDKRRSGMWQGEDGSIIIRDAWGSEIVMIGGNIQIACAGNVEILPGKSALTLAGDDAIVKAQNSVDIESADKDVRVNAYNNVQIMAGVPDEHRGGITLEANGTAYPWDGKEPEGGEAIRSTGILLKTHEGNLVTDTKYTVLRSSKMTSVLSGEKQEGGKLSGGKVFFSADTVLTYGDKHVGLLTDDAVVFLQDYMLTAAKNVLLASEINTAIFKKDEVLVPMMWAPMEKEIASDLLDKLQPMVKLMSDEEKISINYSEEKLEKMVFKFRSTQECATDRPWEIGSSGQFTLFEPFWVQVNQKFETLKGVGRKPFEDHIEEWTEDTGNPWPGRKAELGDGKYTRIAKWEPENMNDDGFNKPRDKVEDSTPITEVDIFSGTGYQIRS